MENTHVNHRPADVISRRNLVWMLFSQGVAIFPLFLQLTLWLPLVWGFAVLWRIQIHRGAWSYPSAAVRIALGALCLVGLYVSYAGVLGVEPMVAFLVSSFTLKLIEVRKKKDVLLVLFITFFAIGATFLFQQGPLMAIYALFACVVNIAAWESTFTTREKSYRGQFNDGGMILLQALPIFFILFLVIPRIPPLWTIPNIAGGGKTGFGDTMSPGDISQLALSGETAFRVEFHGDKRPLQREMYWRGIVLDRFNGRQWRGHQPSWYSGEIEGGNRPHSSWSFKAEKNSPIYNYSIILEPHHQSWLFTLLGPRNISSSMAEVGFAHSLLAITKKPVSTRLKFSGSTFSQYTSAAEFLSREQRTHYTYLPPGYNLRTIELANSWAVRGLTDQEIIQQALTYFKASFTYTLQPPSLGKHSVDEFLFNTQKGFCEHFSSSFVVLMRAAGIPARIVLGYQGGEYNVHEDYLLVKQSDAHAWTEVWLAGRGWVMIDPTAFVSPGRIEGGLDTALTDEDRALINLNGGINAKWLKEIRSILDGIDYRWANLVLGYDSDQQLSILEKYLGGIDPWRVSLFFIGGGALIFLTYLVLFNLGITGKAKTPEQKVLNAFFKKLKKAGYQIEKGESVMQFVNRIDNIDDAKRLEMINIAKAFELAAYNNDPAQLEKMDRAVKKLTLKAA